MKIKIFIVIIVAVILNIITAYSSVGYYWWDEHFQIIEFMNQKMNHLNASQLPWEFAYKIRSSLQPFVYLMSTNVFKFFGVENTFTLAFLFRLMSVAFAMFAQIFFIKTFIASNKYKNSYIPYFITLLFWINIYTNSRTSGETFSASCILLAAAFISKICGTEYQKLSFKNFTRLTLNFDLKLMFLVGLFLGLAFGFRYQSCFFALGIGLWLVIFVKNSFKACLVMTCAFFLIVALNVTLDSNYYGQFPTLPFLNYFNAIRDHIGPGGRVMPAEYSSWYFYIESMYNSLHMIGFIFVAVLFLLGIVSFIKHPVILACLLFILAHFNAEHKEFRYLFPMFPLLFALGGIAIENLIAKYIQLRNVILFLVFANYLLTLKALNIIIFSPSEPDIANLQMLQKYARENSLHTYYTNHRDIQQVANLSYNFYVQNYPLVYKHFENVKDLAANPEKPKLVFLDIYEPLNVNAYLALGCQNIYTAPVFELPDYIGKYEDPKFDPYFGRPAPVILICK